MSKLTEQQKRASLQTLSSLLELIASGSPQPYLDKSLLSSQAGTYATSIPVLTVIGMSLNTVKSLSNQWLDGGFKDLDAKRIAAFDRLSRPQDADHKLTRRETQDKRIEELQHKCRILEDDLTHLSAALEFALECMRNYAKLIDDPSYRAIVRENERELFARAGMIGTSPLKSAKILQLISPNANEE